MPLSKRSRVLVTDGGDYGTVNANFRMKYHSASDGAGANTPNDTVTV